MQGSKDQEEQGEKQRGPERGGIKRSIEERLNGFPEGEGKDEGEPQNVQRGQQDQAHGLCPVSQDSQDEEGWHDEAQIEDENRIQGINLFP